MTINQRYSRVFLALCCAVPQWVQALPTGGQVVSGSASISQPTATSLQVTQGSQKAILNWQGFSIGASESVVFQQPNASSVALNRVLGNNPSEIFGRLSANGQVFLVNPNGVLFGRSANVDVGGLVATTLSIQDSDFLAGRYAFANNGSAGAVVNQGNITAVSGYALLAAPQVTNEGVIAARMGTVVLAAGDKVSLDVVGDGLIKVSVDKAALDAAVINKGTIEADGGNVLLSARSAIGLLKTVLNTEGVIRANTIADRNGTIVLDGGDAGIVNVSGAIEARGTDAGTSGGLVKILGHDVGLFGNASLNASGEAGGGTVLVGGNFHGAGPEQNATHAFIDSGASINADAVSIGNGGRIAIWSNNGTQFYGNISARGGATGGDGGFVEVSGKTGLTYAGMADTQAPKGSAGTLLLDPTDITIISGLAAASTVTCAPGTCAVPAGGPFTDNATGNLTDGTLNAQLALNNVAVNATNDIVSQAAVIVNLQTNSLTMTSTAGAINLAGTYNGPGNLNLNFATNLILTTAPTFAGGPTVVATGAGNNTILATNGAWTLTGANSGSVAGVTFASVENLADTGNASITGTGSLGGSLNVTGTTALTSASIVTSGTQTYIGPVTLAGAGATLISTGGTVAFGNTVSGTNTALAISTGTSLNLANAINLCGGALSAGCTGSLTLTAPSITGAGPTTSGALSITSTAAVVNGLVINTNTLTVAGFAGSWIFPGPSVVTSNTAVAPPDIGVSVGGVALLITSTAAPVAQVAISGSAVAAIAAVQNPPPEPKNLETNPPTDTRIIEGGIKLPDCFRESREGESCK